MGTNIYGVILAGGVGSRMGNVEKPKQFLTVGGKPVIVHTIEKFIVNSRFEKIIVLSPAQWINYTRDLVKKYISDSDRVAVIEGGAVRNDTIMNSIKYIEENCGLDEDTIIVTHDSVRPFVTHRIIEDNIDAAIEYGATDTVIPATDTIVEGTDKTFISSIPDRSVMYQGQTPQAFKALKLRDTYSKMSGEDKQILTDACKIMVVNNQPVKLVAGEVSNIKITYPHDLVVAEAIIRGENNVK